MDVRWSSLLRPGIVDFHSIKAAREAALRGPCMAGYVWGPEMVQRGGHGMGGGGGPGIGGL